MILDPRLSAAIAAGRLAGWASRRLGRGSGEAVRGRVTLLADRRALGKLAAGRRVVLVTGTNGKTTTTAMLARALGDGVCTNRSGGNLPQGLVAALSGCRDELTVLEVDEQYLPRAIAETSPVAVVLLNLSRDQLDRVAELRRTAARWRDALSGFAGDVVANVDDPLVVSAASGAEAVTWVSAGIAWSGDAAVCPRCASPLRRGGTRAWSCTCGLRAPLPAYERLGHVLARDRSPVTVLDSCLPGDVNLSNAAVAVVAAGVMGVPAAQAAERVRTATPAGGRYTTVEVLGRDARLLLAKNPSGWAATGSLLRGRAGLLLALNARAEDGKDVSWVWDIDVSALRGHPIAVIGERRYDLALRLRCAGVAASTHGSLTEALLALPAGPVDVVANYSAFAQLAHSLDVAA